jgi:hypothetical protein
MTTFAQHRAAFESFLDCVQGGAGKDAIAGCLAENVVLIGPLSDEPLAHALGMQPWELRTNGA